MGFSASCAFVALHLLSSSATTEAALLGSAQLLGLLMERAQRKREGLEEKLESAELEVREMRRQRAEDARANDKVVGIFASHEQNWIVEKKRLKRNVQALVDELQSTKARNEEAVAELEVKLQMAEELREKAKEEARSAFTDLVSSQRDLEAEIGRALRQAEEAKQQLLEVFEKKDEAVSLAERLSDEIAIMKSDAEQKDEILSAMLRKAKLDSAEKEALRKEAKIDKSKRKQAELEAERWRSKWESRPKKGPKSLPEADGAEPRVNFRSKGNDHGSNSRTLLHEYLGAEWKKERKSLEPKEEENAIATVTSLDRYSRTKGREDLVTSDIEHLQNWVDSEVDKQTSRLERRHYREVEAFVDQMRLKDEKLAAAHWRILSTEVEAKRLHSRIDGLTASLSQMTANNLRLEEILLDKEEEIKSLKEQFGVFQSLESSNSSSDSSSAAYQALWSEMKPREMKSREKDQEAMMLQTRNSYQIDNSEALQNHREHIVPDIVTTSPIDSAATQLVRIEEICIEEAENSETSAGEKEESVALVTLYPRNQIEEEEDVIMDTGHTPMSRNTSHKDATGVIRLPADQKPLTKRDSSGKMDILALGVDYKIRRLKQQLLVLEKLVGKIHNAIVGYDSDSCDDNKRRSEEFELVMSLLNSEVKRFQTLGEKTDDLCRRMNTNSRANSGRGSLSGKTKEQRKLLQSFLEEAFQLQRYMVATGQKLIELQSEISWSFGIVDGLEESAGFSIGQFADVIRTLFRDIQRGTELRIARVIGGIEGTLACSWILSHVK